MSSKENDKENLKKEFFSSIPAVKPAPEQATVQERVKEALLPDLEELVKEYFKRADVKAYVDHAAVAEAALLNVQSYIRKLQ